MQLCKRRATHARWARSRPRESRPLESQAARRARRRGRSGRSYRRQPLAARQRGSQRRPDRSAEPARAPPSRSTLDRTPCHWSPARRTRRRLRGGTYGAQKCFRDQKRAEKLASKQKESSMPEPRKEFTTEEARRYGEAIGIDWASVPFDVAQFQ